MFAFLFPGEDNEARYRCAQPRSRYHGRSELMTASRLAVCLALVFLAEPPAPAAEAPPDFRPDPLSVQRYGPAYRYPQAGWIVLHVEGGPYERGYQHGRLLAP